MRQIAKHLFVAEIRRPVGVIHDRVEPTAGPAMSAFPRLRIEFCVAAKFRDVTTPEIGHFHASDLAVPATEATRLARMQLTIGKTG
jgi:hypothetical protein